MCPRRLASSSFHRSLRRGNPTEYLLNALYKDLKRAQRHGRRTALLDAGSGGGARIFLVHPMSPQNWRNICRNGNLTAKPVAKWSSSRQPERHPREVPFQRASRGIEGLPSANGAGNSRGHLACTPNFVCLIREHCTIALRHGRPRQRGSTSPGGTKSASLSAASSQPRGRQACG